MDALTAFFLGQLSLAILIFAFIKFFIFGEPPETPPHRTRTRRSSSVSLLRHPRLRHKRSAILRGAGPITDLSPSTILSKTYYNVAGHQPETLDWFNVLVAQTLAQLRNEALHDDVMLKSLSAALNGAAKPDFLGSIAVTEMSLGDEFPIFSNCRIIPVDEAGVEVKSVGEGTRLLARLDVDLSDAITLGVETKLVLNYPLPTVAVLPVALAVSVVRFSGTLSISFIPATPPSETTPTESTSTIPPKGTSTPIKGTSYNKSSTSNSSAKPAATSQTSSSAPQTTLAFSFLPDYRLDLSVRSLVGSRSRLQDVPKIAQLVEARIHAWLDERCVEPRYQQVSLPSMWPRKKNTRGGEDDDDDDEDNVDNDGEASEAEDVHVSETADEEGEVTETEGRRPTRAGNVHASLRRGLLQQQSIASSTGTSTPIPAATTNNNNKNITSSSNNMNGSSTATTRNTNSAAQNNHIRPPPSPATLTHNDSLEARMAAEGRILRAAESSSTTHKNNKFLNRTSSSAAAAGSAAAGSGIMSASGIKDHGTSNSNSSIVSSINANTADAATSTGRSPLSSNVNANAGAGAGAGVGAVGNAGKKRLRTGRNHSTEQLHMPGRFD